MSPTVPADIVKRLRSWRGGERFGDEAADEIEQLRAEIEQLRAALADTTRETQS